MLNFLSALWCTMWCAAIHPCWSPLEGRSTCRWNSTWKGPSWHILTHHNTLPVSYIMKRAWLDVPGSSKAFAKHHESTFPGSVQSWFVTMHGSESQRDMFFRNKKKENLERQKNGLVNVLLPSPSSIQTGANLYPLCYRSDIIPPTLKICEKRSKEYHWPGNPRSTSINFLSPWLHVVWE